MWKTPMFAIWMWSAFALAGVLCAVLGLSVWGMPYAIICGLLVAHECRRIMPGSSERG